MKILVPLKRVPDYEAKIKLRSDELAVQTEGIKWIINPFDEIAVEEALKIKEARPETDITVVTIGPAAAAEQLRMALAMGADRAVLVTTDQDVDSTAAARILAAVFKRDDFRLVMMGKQAIDTDASQTGPRLAAILGLPQATFASKVEIGGDAAAATVTREVDGGLETISIKLPGVVTTDLRLNVPRYPSLPGIVKAKKKPLEELTLDQLGVQVPPSVRIMKLSLPAARRAGVKVSSVAELVDKLKNEAKVV